MIRTVIPAVCALTAPAYAGSVAYLCTVADVCEFSENDRINCEPSTQNRTFDLFYELGEGYIDGTAFIDFEGTSITLDQNGFGHGPPPPMIEGPLGEDPAPYIEAAKIEAQNRPPVPSSGSIFGSVDAQFLSLSRGWSDGRNDMAQLITPINGVQTSFDASCTCVGETQC